METDLKEGMSLFLDIKRVGINGEGIAYYKKLAVFIEGALPGENIFVEITKVTPKYAFGKIKELKGPSKDRCNHFCDYYTKCGACSLQHLNYNASGEIKRQMVAEAISRYTTINPRSFEIKPTILMENPYNYRYKASLPARAGEHGVVFGLYAANSEKFVRVKSCGVQHELIDDISLKIARAIDSVALKGYDLKRHTGAIKYLVVRLSHFNLDAQVTLVLAKKCDHLKELSDSIMKIDHVKSVYYSINDNDEDSMIFGETIVKLAGEDSIVEKIGDYKYNLLPTSFFQLNPYQTEVLYEEIKKASKLSFKETLIDAYCGVGTIGIYLSKMCKEVIGIEVNKEAIQNAIDNTELNKVNNVRCIEGDVTNVLPYLVKEKGSADVIVFDPPRSGLTKEVIKATLKCEPKTIVYVSCNPSTLAKDLADLTSKYNIKYIQPIDMFPFTSHVESVVCLSLKK